MEKCEICKEYQNIYNMIDTKWIKLCVNCNFRIGAYMKGLIEG